MQWIALIGHARMPITADRAKKQTEYLCPECQAVVRVRSGPHRQPHFYHIRASSGCAQHKKSEEHFYLQCKLSSRLGPQARMERPFPEINRIADVAWEERKVIFEIQCSPISLAEVQGRCADYRSLGWEIIWILSDKQYNRRTLSAAEVYLRGQTSYFSEWKDLKQNRIYDQNEILKGFYRIYKSAKIEIDPVQVTQHMRTLPPFALPHCLQERWQRWPLRVEGDLLSRINAQEVQWISSAQAAEKRKTQNSASGRLPWLTLLKQAYLHLLNKFLQT
ncbi:MAG TPA: competence protein CoiA family protein [Rhabdochlamydiaceae bacterium]